MARMTNRRAFLCGRALQDLPDVMRPPGAVLEGFSDLCTACGDCIPACPENILHPDSDGKPVVRLEVSACTFCGKCASACTSGALEVARMTDWAWRAKILPSCLALNGVSCRACQDVCDESAIGFRLLLGGRAEPLLETDDCTGCGACASACPVGAVEFERNEPQILETAE